jgi:hypothetical protein
MPVYNANIPQPTDQISVSQDQILQNFQSLNPFILGIYDFPPQATIPTFTAGDVGLYAKIPAAPFPLTGVNELFITKSNGSNVLVTGSGLGTTGWSYLPSGILLKWGFTSSATSPNPYVVTFPTGAGIPVFNNCYSVQVSLATGPSTDQNLYLQLVGNPTATNFTIYTGLRTTIGIVSSAQFNYLAIGN